MRIVPSHIRLHRPGAACARLAALSALVVLGAGCGEHLVKVESSVLRLRVDEFSITPQLVQVHAGRLKIEVVNTGILTHNVRVESQRRTATGGPIVLGGTNVAQPGERVFSIDPNKLDLQPGRYLLIDTIANHADLGAYATLIVK